MALPAYVAVPAREPERTTVSDEGLNGLSAEGFVLSLPCRGQFAPRFCFGRNRRGGWQRVTGALHTMHPQTLDVSLVGAENSTGSPPCSDRAKDAHLCFVREAEIGAKASALQNLAQVAALDAPGRWPGNGRRSGRAPPDQSRVTSVRRGRGLLVSVTVNWRAVGRAIFKDAFIPVHPPLGRQSSLRHRVQLLPRAASL